MTSDTALPASLGGEPRETLVLRSAEFRKGREQGWVQLDHLVTRIEKDGVASLSAEEARQLPLLYRVALSSLSVARNIVLDRNLLLYLENLSFRAYLAVYGPRSGVMQNAVAFFTSGFPRAVRALRWHLAIAALLTLVGVIAGYIVVKGDMVYFNMLIPESLAGGRGPASTTQELIESELFMPWPGFIETFVVFANSLFRHNALVGIFCFGLGFALGVPTLLLLLYNGLILGAFIALHAEHGLTLDFIGWLMIHGVTELLAIFLCGAAGLLVAEKILFPGVLPRVESLALYGCKAASVVAGAVLLFFIAGFIEGGFRQLINNTPGRYAFAAVSAGVWFMYFYAVGKGETNGSSD